MQPKSLVGALVLSGMVVAGLLAGGLLRTDAGVPPSPTPTAGPSEADSISGVLYELPPSPTPTARPSEADSVSGVLYELGDDLPAARACATMWESSRIEAPRPHGVSDVLPAKVADALARHDLDLADFERRKILPDTILLSSADPVSRSGGVAPALAVVVGVALFSSGWDVTGMGTLYECSGMTPPEPPRGEPIEVTPMPTN